MKLPEHIKDKLYGINSGAIKLQKWIDEVEAYIINRGFDKKVVQNKLGESLEKFKHGNGDIAEFERLIKELDHDI